MCKPSSTASDAESLALYQRDLSDAGDCLRSNRLAKSTDPHVQALERIRVSILDLLTVSQTIIRSRFEPTEHHTCDRPEDCCHPVCRDHVDAWSLTHASDVIPLGPTS